MSPEVLKRIFAEGQPDYSAEICAHANLEALEDGAIVRLRALLAKRSAMGDGLIVLLSNCLKTLS